MTRLRKIDVAGHDAIPQVCKLGEGGGGVKGWREEQRGEFVRGGCVCFGAKCATRRPGLTARLQSGFGSGLGRCPGPRKKNCRLVFPKAPEADEAAVFE
jgi:hypothetical protein